MNEVRFSILVHASGTDPELFKKMLESAVDINYMNYEMIIIDSNPVTVIPSLLREIFGPDGRISYKKSKRELKCSEAYNIGLRAMSGDYCCFLGQHDQVSPDWLEKMEHICISTLIPTKKDLSFDDLTRAASGGRLRQWKLSAPDIIYSDYDEIQDDTRINPHFLGAFNPELLMQYDYIGPAYAVSMGLLRKLRFFDESLDNSETYEYLIRALEYYMYGNDSRRRVHSFEVAHCPGLLYHKRIRTMSPDMEKTYNRKIYENHVKIVEAFLKRNHISARVIKDRSYKIHEIKRKGSDYLAHKKDYTVLRDKNVKVTFYDRALSAMYAHLKQPDVAVVGCMFVNGGKILNAGYIYDEKGIIYPACAGESTASAGYENRIRLAQDVSMVDPDFCMMDAEVYKKLGGFKAGLLKRDAMLDYCLRVRASGYRVVFEPAVTAKDSDRKPESSRESNRELMAMYGEKGSSEKIRISDGDPFYNPNLKMGVENYTF